MPEDPSIVTLTGEHLPSAAQLLADRQRRLRLLQPELPERWTVPGEARSLIDAALVAAGAEGFAAIEGGRLVGYLIGSVRLDPPWERTGWVDLAGHAVAEENPDLARDLYAAWSDRLVRKLGIFRHLVNVPAADRSAVDTWHQLNFGQMHCNALRATDPSDLQPRRAGLVVRRSTADDAELMERTSELIWREQAGAPSWSPIVPEAVEGLRADYVEELTLPHDNVWVAEDASTGEALGVGISYRLEPDLDVPDDNMKLASTTTFPAARRRGVATELVRAILEDAVSRGAGWCVTDWRTSSLRASRSWTALGFRPTRLRLERRIDERIAWANGGA